MLLSLVDEAVGSGARQRAACQVLEFSARTVQLWGTQRPERGEDRRHGPTAPPHNKVAKEERQTILDVANSAEIRDQSPGQIAMQLADRGEHIASESVYGVLMVAGQNTHRGPVKAQTYSKPAPPAATGQSELPCCDIRFLPAAVRGAFFYPYVFLDVWSRKMVAWAVRERECEKLALHDQLLEATCEQLGSDSGDIVLHFENSSAMKGTTMLARRPAARDDNPFIESLFRTLKYRPGHLIRRFADIEEAAASIEAFVRWYNPESLDLSIGFVPPHAHHASVDLQVLAHRRTTYEAARAQRPERWTSVLRNSKRPGAVHLNPDWVAIMRAPRAQLEVSGDHNSDALRYRVRVSQKNYAYYQRRIA